MHAVIAPNKTRYATAMRPTVFLAGSIDQGETADWQAKVTADYMDHDIAFLNPRRENWEKNANESQVREQIYWEMDGLANCDAIIIYFHPDSLATISLLELGLYARDQKVIVVCPPGYWRRVNVAVTCERYRIPIFDDLDEGMRQVVALAQFKFNLFKSL